MTASTVQGGRSRWDRAARGIVQHGQSLIALAVRAGSLLAGFAVTYFIGHRLGPAANGQYALVTQTALFLSVLGLLGLDVAVVRHFSGAAARKLRLDCALFLKVACIALALMVALSALLALTGQILWQPLFGKVVPSNLLPIACVLLIGRGGSRLFGAILRSQHRFVLGQAIDVLVIPLAAAALIGLGVVNTLPGILWATALVALASMAFGFAAGLGRTAPRSHTVPTRTLVASALPLWGAGVSANIGDWFGLAIAASVLGAQDTGLFRVAVQAASVMQVISLALFSVYAPKISTSFHVGDLACTGHLTRTATRLSAACAIPLAIALLVFAEPLLGLIGPEFRAAAGVLRVLVVGQLFFTLTGPCGLTMAMSGHERLNLLLTVVATVLLFVLVPVATRMAGLMGLAVCMSIVLMVRNVASLVLLNRMLGLNVVTGRLRPAPTAERPIVEGSKA